MIRNQLVTNTDQIYDGVNPCTTITIHETDNPRIGAHAQAHANLQSSGNVRQASWHIQVDEDEAIRSYPNEAQCWHAGTDEGNRTSFAVEICVNADGDYNKAFARAAKTVAELREELALGRSAVVQHSVWKGKNCPAQMRLTHRWDEFVNLTDPKPKETTVANTPAQAIAKSKTITRGYVGLCLVFVRTCFGVAAKYPTASSGWANATKKHKTSSTANIPAGVPIWFYVPGLPAGHVALYLGGGKCRMNVSHKGTVETVSVSWYLNFSNGTLLGWTEDINGVTIYSGSADSSADNKTIQSALKNMGFYKGVIDGVDGTMQQSAVKAFQKKYGLVQDSDWGPVVQAKYEALGSPGSAKKPAAKPTVSKPAVSNGNSKADNIAIQRALNKMGINVGKEDGIDGTWQQSGVKKFQKAHGLVADGKWQTKTQAVFEQNKRVQSALKKKGYTKQTVDGYRGNQTIANLKDFQRRAGLKQDAIAGPITRKHLGI